MNCSICQDSTNSGLAAMLCGHVFHHECISTWFIKKKKSRCPLCQETNTRLIRLYLDFDETTVQLLQEAAIKARCDYEEFKKKAEAWQTECMNLRDQIVEKTHLLNETTSALSFVNNTVSNLNAAREIVYNVLNSGTTKDVAVYDKDALVEAIAIFGAQNMSMQRQLYKLRAENNVYRFHPAH